LIQEYRSNTKILSSYIESPEALAHNGFIHPDWDIGGTDTGRASCKDPPVHSQPKTYRDIVTSRWKEHGGCILSFDQSQVEVRGFASLADDQFLIQTYNTPGADIHRMLASLIFGKQPQDISDDERSIAKTCVFASLYGGGPGRLAGQTGLPFDRAEAIHNRFTSIVSSEKYKERMAAFLFQNGYVTTPFGRKRTIPVGQTMGERNHAIRQAANTPIQSACSDISLESIGRLWYRMRQGGMQTKIIIWHHDAIVWDVYPGELFKLVGMADYAMRVEPMAMYSWLKVPLKIEGGLGLDWKNLLDIGTWTGDTVDVEGEEKDVLMLQRSGISEAYTVTLVESKAEEKKGKHVVITKATLRQR
jgi:DNA polymerase-1